MLLLNRFTCKFDLTKTKVVSVFGIFIIFGLISCFYTSVYQYSFGQASNWDRYVDPGKKFSFSHPHTWTVNSSHIESNGVTEVTLSSSNSTRMKISIMYTPKDASLDSNSGKPVVLSRALTILEEDIGQDYRFFNSTGKFPHKYSIQGHESASDLIDYEKNEGQPGKMLLVLTSANNDDTLLYTYTDSKRSFFKNLSIASQIIKSLSISS
jgi:hypothetical protein